MYDKYWFKQVVPPLWVLYYQLLLLINSLGMKYFHCHGFNWELLSAVWWRPLHNWIMVLGRFLWGGGWPRPSTGTGLKRNKWPHDLLFCILQPKQQVPSLYLYHEKLSLYILCFRFWEIKVEDSFMLRRACVCHISNGCS